MRYYIPTSTLNISNILSSGSISPYSYYGKRQFGIKSFEPIKECEKFKDQIILFRNYPLFSIVSDKESYPVCIEIELPDNMVIPSNIPDVYYASKTIYISPSNISFVFENEEYLNKSLFWIDISDEAKFFDQYKDKFILRDGLSETFTLTSNTLDNLIIGQTLDLETEVMKDWKIDKIRGAICGMYIGANGFDGLDGTGIGYNRNLIKSLFSQLLRIFDGRAQLVTRTSQLEMSALSEFAKKEQRIRQLCSVSTSGQLKILYNADKEERVDFYDQLLNRILVNSDSLTQQEVSQEGGKLLSALYGNRWKSSFDYSYLIKLYNNVTRYDDFDLKSNESIILRSFAAFVQRGLGEWDKLRDYLNERNETLPDRRFIYGLYGAVNGFSTLSKTMTDTVDISDNALNGFITDMNENSMIDSDVVVKEKNIIGEVKDESVLSNEKTEKKEQHEAFSSSQILETTSLDLDLYKQILTLFKYKDLEELINSLKRQNPSECTIEKCLNRVLAESPFKKARKQCANACQALKIYLNRENKTVVTGIIDNLDLTKAGKKALLSLLGFDEPKKNKNKRDSSEQACLFPALDIESEKIGNQSLKPRAKTSDLFVDDINATDFIKSRSYLPIEVRNILCKKILSFQTDYAPGGYYFKDNPRTNDNTINHFIRKCTYQKEHGLYPSWVPSTNENKELLERLKSELYERYAKR